MKIYDNFESDVTLLKEAIKKNVAIDNTAQDTAQEWVGDGAISLEHKAEYESGIVYELDFTLSGRPTWTESVLLPVGRSYSNSSAAIKYIIDQLVDYPNNAASDSSLNGAYIRSEFYGAITNLKALQSCNPINCPEALCETLGDTLQAGGTISISNDALSNTQINSEYPYHLTVSRNNGQVTSLVKEIVYLPSSSSSSSLPPPSLLYTEDTNTAAYKMLVEGLATLENYLLPGAITPTPSANPFYDATVNYNKVLVSGAVAGRLVGGVAHGVSLQLISQSNCDTGYQSYTLAIKKSAGTGAETITKDLCLLQAQAPYYNATTAAYEMFVKDLASSILLTPVSDNKFYDASRNLDTLKANTIALTTCNTEKTQLTEDLSACTILKNACTILKNARTAMETALTQDATFTVGAYEDSKYPITTTLTAGTAETVGGADTQVTYSHLLHASGLGEYVASIRPQHYTDATINLKAIVDTANAINSTAHTIYDKNGLNPKNSPFFGAILNLKRADTSHAFGTTALEQAEIKAIKTGSGDVYSITLSLGKGLDNASGSGGASVEVTKTTPITFDYTKAANNEYDYQIATLASMSKRLAAIDPTTKSVSGYPTESDSATTQTHTSELVGAITNLERVANAHRIGKEAGGDTLTLSEEPEDDESGVSDTSGASCDNQYIITIPKAQSGNNDRTACTTLSGSGTPTANRAVYDAQTALTEHLIAKITTVPSLLRGLDGESKFYRADAKLAQLIVNSNGFIQCGTELLDCNTNLANILCTTLGHTLLGVGAITVALSSAEADTVSVSVGGGTITRALSTNLRFSTSAYDSADEKTTAVYEAIVDNLVAIDTSTTHESSFFGAVANLNRVQAGLALERSLLPLVMSEGVEIAYEVKISGSASNNLDITAIISDTDLPITAPLLLTGADVNFLALNAAQDLVCPNIMKILSIFDGKEGAQSSTAIAISDTTYAAHMNAYGMALLSSYAWKGVDTIDTTHITQGGVITGTSRYTLSDINPGTGTGTKTLNIPWTDQSANFPGTGTANTYTHGVAIQNPGLDAMIQTIADLKKELWDASPMNGIGENAGTSTLYYAYSESLTNLARLAFSDLQKIALMSVFPGILNIAGTPDSATRTAFYLDGHFCSGDECAMSTPPPSTPLTAAIGLSSIRVLDDLGTLDNIVDDTYGPAIDLILYSNNRSYFFAAHTESSNPTVLAQAAFAIASMCSFAGAGAGAGATTWVNVFSNGSGGITIIPSGDNTVLPIGIVQHHNKIACATSGSCTSNDLPFTLPSDADCTPIAVKSFDYGSTADRPYTLRSDDQTSFGKQLAAAFNKIKLLNHYADLKRQTLGSSDTWHLDYGTDGTLKQNMDFVWSQMTERPNTDTTWDFMENIAHDAI